jgi:PAS domain S-box-containing protein
MSDETGASEARLRAIIDAALDAVVTTDARSVITGWSAQAETLFGWTAEEAMGRGLGETIIPPRYRDAHDAGVRRYLQTGEGPILNRRIEVSAVNRDGVEFPVELTVAVAHWGGEVLFCAFVRDLTDRRRAEARLAAEHAVTRALADAASVEAAARPVLRALGQALAWEAGFLWTVDGDRLRARAHWSAGNADTTDFDAATRALALARGEGVPGTVWATGEPVWIVDAATDPRFRRTTEALRAGLHAGFAFAVQAGTDFLGVIELFSREPAARPDDKLLAMARAIGSDVGQAFRRMRAEEERDRALAEARTSNERLRRANAELAVRTEEAERANQAKSDFLAVMSHELRTPINAVLGYTDLLEMEIAGPVTAEQAAYLRRVRASTTHLLGLINDVLDLSKIEAGRMGVAREAHPVRASVQVALGFVATQAEAKGVRLENACADRGTEYLGDDDRVRQVLLNLLSNAVKFTDGAGRVTVRCGTGRPEGAARLAGPGPWVCIRVEDTGVGIAPEETEAVFEPFVQAESVLTRTAGGTGLGLTISRRLARMMGGDLTVESELGRGSCFTLWLPAAGRVEAPADPEAAEAAPAARDDAEVLRAAGNGLQHELPAVLTGFAARLRQEASLHTDGVPDAALEDHQATLLADVAQCLIAIADAPGEVSLLRDGTELQRLLAFRHGEQRARLGWDEPGLRRECGVLADEVRAALDRRAVPPDAWGILTRFLRRAEEVSAAALCAARKETGAGDNVLTAEAAAPSPAPEP